MATTAARKRTTTEQGLGGRHQTARAALLRRHTDGSPCDWCGRAMYKDPTRNPDYRPDSVNRDNGKLQADHSKMSRAEALKLGIPVTMPDRLLHGECNRQRGDGSNDHLAWINSGRPPVLDVSATSGVDTSKLVMGWPW